MEAALILLSSKIAEKEGQDCSAGSSLGIILLIIAVIAFVMGYLWFQKRAKETKSRFTSHPSKPQLNPQQKPQQKKQLNPATSKPSSSNSTDNKALSQMAMECWESYQKLLKAKGCVKACMNFLTGDGGLESLVTEMEDANTRFGTKPDKLVFIVRESESARLVNYGIGHGFLKDKEWSLPSTSAPGYNTKEAYFASIGYNPSSNNPALLTRLRGIKDNQEQETKKCLNDPVLQQVKDTFPIIKNFLSVLDSTASDNEVLNARNNFLKQLNTIIHE